MDMFAGKTLIRADGSEHPAEEALCDVKVVALYFSAHWCPPCRHFTPILADAYAEAKQALPCGAEVVFVSPRPLRGGHGEVHGRVPRKLVRHQVRGSLARGAGEEVRHRNSHPHRFQDGRHGDQFLRTRRGSRPGTGSLPPGGPIRRRLIAVDRP
ncbi:hypothetical protein MRX96_021081 [Rhipicephalus microplus]